MNKKLLAVLPATIFLVSCAKKTPNCASPEATNLAQKQTAQQLVAAGVEGYSESEILGMISVSNIQTVSADANVNSYKCKATATINYPQGLAGKISAAAGENNALLYDIPKMLAQKYGLNAIAISTKLAGIVMGATMQGINANDAFTAALEKGNKSDVTYDIFKIEKSKDNMHYGVSAQLPDGDFVKTTVFYMNIGPVIEAYSKQAQAKEAAPTTDTAPPQKAAETAPATVPADSVVEATPAQEAVTAKDGKPETKADSIPEASPTENDKPVEKSQESTPDKAKQSASTLSN